MTEPITMENVVVTRSAFSSPVSEIARAKAIAPLRPLNHNIILNGFVIFFFRRLFKQYDKGKTFAALPAKMEAVATTKNPTSTWWAVENKLTPKIAKTVVSDATAKL
mmetsp:Transcript_33686/g.86354  ORF Transcript_33686/g.86354 Transcript_33686/m.86354 type:complete len:107 (-) Transcript_33686:1426-1746(-)